MKRSGSIMKLIVAAMIVGFAGGAIAEQDIQISKIISDGKDGRPFDKVIQHVAEKPVHRISIALKKVNGGDDCFVNVRFGEDGNTLDGGKRVYLKSNEREVHVWNVGGILPAGKPVVVNAYNGQVAVGRMVVGNKP